MSIQHKVLKALSEAFWMDTWPADYIHIELINRLTSNSRRIVKLASLLIEFAPIFSRANLFSRLDRNARIQWMDSLDPKSITKDMLGILEFLLSAVYFVNKENASRIGYERKPLTQCLPARPREQRLANYLSNMKRKYDVVIIGSGAGGAVAAWRIASEGISAAVFEAGPEPRNINKEHPVIKAVKYYWDNGLTFTMGKPAISLPFGRVLGGTVTVNSGTMFRIPEEVLNRWREITGIKIYWSQLKKAYRVIEERLVPIFVNIEEWRNNAKIMKMGAENLGLRHYPVMRPIGDCCGAGECAFVCPYDGKIDMRLSFLREGKRYGLEIYCNTPVKKIVRRGDRALGILVDLNGHQRFVEADVIVVSAGALNTPNLLRRLDVDNKNIGKHLHIHPAVGVTAIMNKEVYGWRGTMQSYCVDELFNEYHTLLLATFPPPGIGYSAGSIPLQNLNKYPFLASIGVQCSDDGEGAIPSFRLFGIAKYDIIENDIDKIRRGILLATEILLAAGAEEVYLPLKKMISVKKVSHVEKILCEKDIRYFKLSAYHPMSTARMGSDEDVGVVDNMGRVYGFDNLYVADASILPSTTYVNPQLTINALSLMAAEYIIENM